MLAGFILLAVGLAKVFATVVALKPAGRLAQTTLLSAPRHI
jgi:hypothetical protein